MILRSGKLYRHDLAKDIYIEVLKAYHIKPTVWVIKAKIFNALYGNYLETVKFRVDGESIKMWEQI